MRFSDRIEKLFRRTYLLHTTREGEGPIIIFLHGIGSSSDNWLTLIPLLKDSFTCITIDLLGFGKSPKPDWSDYTIEDHTKSIHKTIKNLSLKQPFLIVGHSLGSLLACRYAAENPSHINRLIMVSPPVYLSPSQHGKTRSKNTTNAYLKVYKYLRNHKKFTLKNAARISRLLPNPSVLNLNESTWTAFTRTLENCIENQTAITDITKVSAPINVLYGSRDQLIMKDNMKILGALKNVEITEAKGAGHVIRIGFAKEIANVVKTFPIKY